MKLFIILKLLFSIFLLLIFVFYFGLPSWEKFQAEEVMNNRRMLINKGNDSITPALTICATNPGTHSGWKYDGRYPEFAQLSLQQKKSLLKRHPDLINLCNGTTDIQDCVEKSTNNLQETMKCASAQRPEGKIDFNNPKNWAKEMTFVVGMCHTFNKSVPLDSVGRWAVDFHQKFDYTLIIHDPNYFMVTTNPATIPFIMTDFHKEDLGLILTYIEAIKHINIDRPSQPCNGQSDYSFTACIKNSLSSKVGCRYFHNQ